MRRPVTAAVDLDRFLRRVGHRRGDLAERFLTRENPWWQKEKAERYKKWWEPIRFQTWQERAASRGPSYRVTVTHPLRADYAHQPLPQACVCGGVLWWKGDARMLVCTRCGRISTGPYHYPGEGP